MMSYIKSSCTVINTLTAFAHGVIGFMIWNKRTYLLTEFITYLPVIFTISPSPMVFMDL